MNLQKAFFNQAKAYSRAALIATKQAWYHSQLIEAKQNIGLWEISSGNIPVTYQELDQRYHKWRKYFELSEYVMQQCRDDIRYYESVVWTKLQEVHGWKLSDCSNI